MRPFWRYYGGKWAAVSRGLYPAPRHGLIIEPFAGAAGYSCHYWWMDVVLVERDPVVAATWRWLLQATPDDVLAIPDIPDGGTVDDIDAPEGARLLAGWWCNNGAAQPCKTPSAWARASEHSGWGGKVRERIALQVGQIRHWKLIEGHYDQAPDARACWFVDPPYQTAAGRHYRHHDIDYPALGRWVEVRSGQVIACDQVGAEWLRWSGRLDPIGAPGRYRSGKSSEVVYLRGCDEQMPLLEERWKAREGGR